MRSKGSWYTHHYETAKSDSNEKLHHTYWKIFVKTYVRKVENNCSQNNTFIKTNTSLYKFDIPL